MGHILYIHGIIPFIVYLEREKFEFQLKILKSQKTLDSFCIYIISPTNNTTI